MIVDLKVSATLVASAVLWATGGAFVIVGYFFDLWFTGVGLWLSGIGGVLWIRRMLCRQELRLQNAFELGRDYERASRLRSIS